MFQEKSAPLLAYEKAEREVKRILAGPVPIEQHPLAVWEATLHEAQVSRNRALEDLMKPIPCTGNIFTGEGCSCKNCVLLRAAIREENAMRDPDYFA